MSDEQLIWESYIENHLRERGVDPDKTRVIIDKETNTATFFLYNLTGQLVGYQMYNPKGSKDVKRVSGNRMEHKYWPYVSHKGEKPELAVWGLESYSMNVKYLFIAEGIFDAVKIQNAGYAAIATLANNPTHLASWLSTLPQIKIAIQDNDENKAGDKLGKFGDYNFFVPKQYHDLGDMPQAEVDAFIKECISLVEYK